MRSLLILLILLFSCSVEAITVKKIDRYGGVDFYPIEGLYCSFTDRLIKFRSKHQYKSIYVTLLSPHGNGIIKIEHPKQIISNNTEIKILRGEEKSIRMKLLPFDGKCKIKFYDSITQELLSELTLEGVLGSNITQRTTAQYGKKFRINHNIQYKDWSVSVGLRESNQNSIESSISISKRWR